MSARSPVVLLAGPGSRRLEALALERAAEVICGPGFDPESSCARRVFRKEHPDLMVAAPERRRRVNPPQFEENEGKETTLPTALVRAVAADATRLPYEAARRAILFLDVDRTEAAAFSALLKILEESPTKTRFVLTATRPRLLPATILAPARMAWIVFKYGENNLSNDYIARVPVVAAILEGRYPPTHLFLDTMIWGGHSWLGLLPIYWAAARFFAWDLRAELGLGLCLAALKVFLVRRTGSFFRSSRRLPSRFLSSRRSRSVSRSSRCSSPRSRSPPPHDHEAS